MIIAIHKNQFKDISFNTDAHLNSTIPSSCPNIPDNILNPIEAWSDKNAYLQQANKLKTHFGNNYLKLR